MPSSARTDENIINVAAVPTAGMVTKVGKNVPMILPIVFKAPNFPTITPLFSRSSMVYFTRDGVTVPSSIRGNTKITRQQIREAQTRKFFSTTMATAREIPAITYLPAKGIAAIQTAAINSRPNSRPGSGFLSAIRPPQIFPKAMAIMIVPMITVQTI